MAVCVGPGTVTESTTGMKSVEEMKPTHLIPSPTANRESDQSFNQEKPSPALRARYLLQMQQAIRQKRARYCRHPIREPEQCQAERKLLPGEEIRHVEDEVGNEAAL